MWDGPPTLVPWGLIEAGTRGLGDQGGSVLVQGPHAASRNERSAWQVRIVAGPDVVVVLACFGSTRLSISLTLYFRIDRAVDRISTFLEWSYDYKLQTATYQGCRALVALSGARPID